MDVMDEDILSFWKELNNQQLPFIMIGGVAMRFHGFHRSTDDLDLWMIDTPENRRKLRNAFFNLGYGDFHEIETMQFIPGWTTFLISANIELDIITEMVGVEASFEDCYQMALVQDLEGIVVRFLDVNHLLENKQALQRTKDLTDIEYLRKLMEME
jgi:hypothetical protein